MVGLVHDLAHVTGLAWREAGDAIWLLGAPLEAGAAALASPDARVSLAGSSYLEVIHGQLTGRPPEVDLDLERSVQAFLRRAIAAGLVASAHDLSDGGLAVAAAEASMASGLGAHLEIPASSARLDRLLFAEGGARVLVTVPPSQIVAWQDALDGAVTSGGPLPAVCLGVVKAVTELSFNQAGQQMLALSLGQLLDTYEAAIPRRLGVDLPPSSH
jgi:phosphoribosylformylglycinamidine synthase